jgi:hypothetical protein
MRLEKWKALLDRMQDHPSQRQAVQAAATANDLAQLATTLSYALTGDQLLRLSGQRLGRGKVTDCPPGGAGPAIERSSPFGGIAPHQSRVIVVVSALESAMSDGNQPSPVGTMKDDRRGNANWDVFSQLQRTRQWDAEGSQLLRPADFHAWAAVGWATP